MIKILYRWHVKNSDDVLAMQQMELESASVPRVGDTVNVAAAHPDVYGRVQDVQWLIYHGNSAVRPIVSIELDKFAKPKLLTI